MELARYLESTNLKVGVTGREIDELVHEANELQFHGVCVPPFWVKRASREVAESLQLVTVVGFPLGYQMTEVKMEEARLAIRDGAHELDMVLNISAVKDGIPWPKIELAKMAALCHDHGVLLKVIIEVAYFSDTELVKVARMVADAGADFVKTATGFTPDGEVNVAQVQLLRASLPSSVGIKASGGIRTRARAISLIRAGADRIGTSNAKQLLSDGTGDSV